MLCVGGSEDLTEATGEVFSDAYQGFDMGRALVDGLYSLHESMGKGKRSVRYLKVWVKMSL